MKKLLVVLAAVVASTGCGYHTAGKAVRLPSDVHTIAIPAFVNQTQTYRLEQILTAAVVREFVSRTNYRIADSADEPADATLKGTVTSAQLAPLTYDAKTGRASTGLVTVNMRVSLLDRQGKVIWENQNYTYREEYQISRDVASFFEEDSPAIDRLSRDFARTLVGNILEAY